MVLALLLVLVLAGSQQATSRVMKDSYINLQTIDGREGFPSVARRSLSNVDAQAQNSRAEPRNIPSQYIVFLDETAGAASIAAQSLVAEVTKALAARATEAGTASTAAAGGNSAEEDIRVISDLSNEAPIAASPAAAAAATASSSTAGVQALLVKASRAAARQIRRSKLVRHVIQDREVVSQQVLEAAQLPQAAVVPQKVKRRIRQTLCVEAIYLSQGVPAAVSTDLKWPGCRVAGSKLVWRGTTCGDGSKVRYIELRAVNSQGGLIKPTCILRPNPSQPAWTRHRFGSCGVQPTFTTALPTTICSATGGGGSGGSPPSGGSVSNPPAPSTDPLRSGPLLPRVPVVSGETVPSSLSRIEAATAAGVDSTEGLPAGRQVAVAIIDSGIDGLHPDLNVVGGQTWATVSTKAGDVTNYDVDYYGHGTHVAGIVAARNSGQGYLGVVPNTPLYSLKILNGEGKGTLSSAIAAVKWSYSAAGVAAKIGVINLSLAAKLDPTSTTYKDDLTNLCSVFVEASNAGIVVTAAAGNYGADMTGYIPASCPTVMAVTSIDADSNSASGFSNFLPNSAAVSDKSMLIAAPGSDVPSTMSYKVDSSGYRSLSGTSMASPHIAGVAAACIMSGACSAGTTGVAKAAVLQAAAQQRLSAEVSDTTPKYSFTGTNGNYYGNLVWAKW